MTVTALARPEIRALDPYEAAAQVDDTVRLNANESPVASDIGGFRRPLNRYPEVRPAKLQVGLARRFGCEPEQLLVTRGSSEAIDLLIRTFCRAGVDSILTPYPSFSMYRHYATIQGAGVIEVPMAAENDFALDVDALLAACQADTRLVFVCSPNNPTGTPLPRADLIRLLDGRADQSVVVVDEAYVEFGDEPSVVNMLADYPNLVVLRTLSKALGFAGARCGAVIGSSDVVRMLNAVQAPYALATPVVECVEDALGDEELRKAEEMVADIVSERERVMQRVASYDFVAKVWPSDANFFLLRSSRATEILNRCAEQKVLLRGFGGDLADCIRISIGSRDDNERLLAALDSLAGDA